MKSKLLLTIALSAICIQSCTTRIATIKIQPKPNDIVVTPEMVSFSLANKNPSVVLRTPFTTSQVSESDAKNLSKYNNIYNQIEKNLLKAGFTVRDRGLLNNLLSTGQTNYAEIGKKIETDVIIEILSIDFNINNYQHKAILKKNNKEVSVPGNMLNPQMAKLECKLTIVDKGLTGAILTLYYTPCIEGCDFQFSYNYKLVTFVGRKEWAYNISWVPDYNQESSNEVIAYFSSIISNILRAK